MYNSFGLPPDGTILGGRKKWYPTFSLGPVLLSLNFPASLLQLTNIRLGDRLEPSVLPEESEVTIRLNKTQDRWPSLLSYNASRIRYQLSIAEEDREKLGPLPKKCTRVSQWDVRDEQLLFVISRPSVRRSEIQHEEVELAVTPQDGVGTETSTSVGESWVRG